MWREVQITDIVIELERDNLLPAIVFRTARSQCDRDSEQASRNKRLHLDPATQRELKAKIHEIAQTYEMDLELVVSHPQYQGLILTGVGAHHAGQLLTWRLLLEELMARGLLRILSATGTVAAGVDFPARTVVITAHSKRGAEGYTTISAAEFQQMSGRAGRRGKDSVGFCVVAPSAFCDARVVAPIAKRDAEPLTSSYFPSPSTALNLLRYRNVDDLHYTVSRSLAAHVDRSHGQELRKESRETLKELSEEKRKALEDALDASDSGDVQATVNGQPIELDRNERRIAKKARRLQRQARELEGRLETMLGACMTGLKNLGYLDGSNLSQKGHWAANLCTNLVIELAETIESGILNNPSSDYLVSVIAALSADGHRQYLKTKNPPLDNETVEKLHDIVERVKAQNMPGIVDEREVIPEAAYTAIVWMQSEDWHSFRSLLLLAGAAEGDAARLITQTAEHLNQLARLVQTHPELALKAERARLRLLRPPLTEVINIEGLA